ncbi:serpin family protein [Gloeobacter kilaueensis]|nr:serpin family protein [Gloeobacter kilaueensis]
MKTPPENDFLLAAPGSANLRLRRSTVLRAGLLLALLGPHRRSLAQETTMNTTLAQAQTEFGFNLFAQAIKQDAGRNVFLSPLSIALVLTMVENGAAGATRTAIAQTLALGKLDSPALNQQSAALLSALESHEAKVQLQIANALWSQQGVAIEAEFTNLARQYYRAQAEELNFAQPEAAQTINRWVEQKTNGKIAKIVAPDDLRSALLVLVNAVYFKAAWQRTFDSKATRNRPFHLAAGPQKDLPFMNQTGRFEYLENEAFQAVRLPYANPNLGMYIFLPKPDLATFEQQLNGQTFQKWLTQFASRSGSLALPRFKIEYAIALKKALTILGMGIAFSSKADFRAMSREPAFLYEVIHKSYIDVNEEGTEAAAATGAIMRATAVMQPVPPFQMIVDRPFFIAIRDNTSGALLFMGRIADPTG